MSSHKQLLQELFKHTKIMHEALENRNIDVVKEMIRKRDILMQQYQALDAYDPDEEDQVKIDQLLLLDKDNNILLEAMVEKEYQKIAKARKNKNDAKKRSVAIGKYVYGAYDAKARSKFNKKT